MRAPLCSPNIGCQHGGWVQSFPLANLKPNCQNRQCKQMWIKILLLCCLFFSPQLILETHSSFGVLFSCDRKTFLTGPPCWKWDTPGHQNENKQKVRLRHTLRQCDIFPVLHHSPIHTACLMRARCTWTWTSQRPDEDAALIAECPRAIWNSTEVQDYDGVALFSGNKQRCGGLHDSDIAQSLWIKAFYL